MAAEKMRAVIVENPGGPESMKVDSAVDKPAPQENEVLIKIMATALNRADTLQRQGKYPVPKGATQIIGLECAGVIESFGEGECKNQHGFKVGDRVMALLSGGGYAEYATAPIGNCIPMPDNYSFRDGAAIPETYLTAFQILHTIAKVKAGDFVLVHAGASGVGLAAVQLVVQAGARAIVTTSSQAKNAACIETGNETAKALGIDTSDGKWVVEAVCRKDNDGNWAPRVKELTGGKGIDIVMDPVAATYAHMNVDVLAIDGRWVLYALLGGIKVGDFNLALFLRKRISLEGTTLRSRTQAYKDKLVKDFTEVAYPALSSGALKPKTDCYYALDQIVEAHQHMEANKNIGKIVIDVQS